VEAVRKEKEMVSPRIGISETALNMLREDLTAVHESDLESAYVRDFGSDPFVHVLGTEWSFLKHERALELSGQQHGNGTKKCFLNYET
jgi:hypothetical protein